MMVANSFDLWQKDSFFSAAEEVQESADLMESAYRLWIKEKGKARALEELDEFCRELQAALGTAKWQLEEFERAVRLSHGNCRDDTTLTRHKQFVAAIENQIRRVESALQEAFYEERKQPFCWVNLNDEERDDLAMFLSGTSQSSESSNNENHRGMNGETSKEIISHDNSSDCVIDIEERESPGSGDTRMRQTDKTAGLRRTLSSSNVSALRIMIPDEDEERKKIMTVGIESTPKEKGSKPLFSLHRYREYNQYFDRISCFPRQLQGPIRLRLSRPIQLTLSLMLMLFLLLPFVSYSS